MFSASLNKTFPSFLPSSRHSVLKTNMFLRAERYHIWFVAPFWRQKHSWYHYKQNKLKQTNSLPPKKKPQKNNKTTTKKQKTKPTHIQEGRKEGNVLFNDALNTFCLRLYGVRHMVMDHSDGERGNPPPPHRLLFPIRNKGSCMCIIPQTG